MLRHAPPALKGLEAQFAGDVSRFSSRLLDLNVPTASLDSMWESLRLLRARILTSYGVLPEQASPPRSFPQERGILGVTPPTRALARGRQDRHLVTRPVTPPPPPPPPAVTPAMVERARAASDDNKGRLHRAVGQRAGRSLTQEEMVYNVAPDASGGGFWASVSSPGLLAQEYFSSAVATTERQAEQSAAKAALESEFPDIPTDDVDSLQEMPGASSGALAIAGGDAKRGRTPNSYDPKSRLKHGVQLMLGRCLVKNEILYEVFPVEPAGSGFKATCCIPAHDANAVYHGEQAADEKQAQHSAANAAFDALKHILEPLEEQQLVKKARVQQERMQKMGGHGGLIEVVAEVGPGVTPLV